MEAKKREREEQHLFLTAKVRTSLDAIEMILIFLQVITDETFNRHEGFDLATFDEKNWPASDLPSFRVLKTETYSTFKSRVAEHFDYAEDHIRLWVLVNRQNKTVRPDSHIPENQDTLSMSFIHQNSNAFCNHNISKLLIWFAIQWQRGKPIFAFISM